MAEVEAVVVDDIDEMIKDYEIRVMRLEAETRKITQSSASYMGKNKTLDSQIAQLELELDRYEASIDSNMKKDYFLTRETEMNLEDYDRMIEIENHKDMVLKSNAEESVEHTRRLKAAIAEFKADTGNIEAEINIRKEVFQAFTGDLEAELAKIREVFAVALQKEASRQSGLKELAVIEAKCKALLEQKS